VAERFEMSCRPLAVGRGFDEHARRRSRGEQLIETLPVGLDAVLDQLAAFGQDADLAGGLVEVYSDVVHGWS
jgi:hypothetical protein